MSAAPQVDHIRTVVLDINPNRVRPFKEQPREYFDETELINLELSIRQRGQLQPGMVKAITDRDHDYEIVDGQRRWHACRKLNIPFRAIVIEPAGLEDQFEIAVAANFQRAGHTPMEIAKAIERMCTQGKRSEEYVARVMGKHVTTVNQYRRLVDLVPEAQAMVDLGRADADRLPVIVAIEVARLPQPDQLRVVREIQSKGLKASAAQDYVRGMLSGTVITGRTPVPADTSRIIRSFIIAMIQRAEHHLQRLSVDADAVKVVTGLYQTQKLTELRGSIIVGIESLQRLHDRLSLAPDMNSFPVKSRREQPQREAEFIYSILQKCPKCQTTAVRFRKRSDADPKTGTWNCMAKGCELRISHVVMKVDKKYAG